jgi:hypothetical protein
MWRTPTSNSISLVSTAFDLGSKNIVLIPGPQMPHAVADERLLHVSGSTVLLQRAEGSGVTLPGVTIAAPNATQYTIRCWVVAEHFSDITPGMCIELDRIVSRDNGPYMITDLRAHNSILEDICRRLFCTTAGIQFHVMWRGEGHTAWELWDIAQHHVVHNCIGIRFETPGARSSASDRMWISGAVGAPCIDLLGDIAQKTVYFVDGDAVVLPVARSFRWIVEFNRHATDGTALQRGVTKLGNGAFRLSISTLTQLNEQALA